MSAEKQALPGHEQQPQEMLCLSCGRYVGGAGRCRYCGARSRKRLSLVVTRWAAVFLATVGLFLLYLMAVNRDIEQVWVGEITPMMNFAYVRITGVVDGEPRVFQRSGRVEGLRFDVEDGTGTIPVSAYRQQAQEIVAAGRVPRAGDQVELVGSLSVSADDRTMLRLQSIEGLRIERVETPPARIAELRPDLEGAVRISGEITEVRAPPPDSRAPWSIRLRDASGEAAVSFWQDVQASLAEPDRLRVGAAVRLRVSIGAYRGQMQLRLERADDLEWLAELADEPKAESAPATPAPPPEPSAPVAIPLAQIAPERAGSLVAVSGVITRSFEPEPGSRAPHRLVIEDDGNFLSIVFWQSVADSLAPTVRRLGNRVRISGILEYYNEQPQLRLQQARNVTVTSWAAAEQETP